MEGGRGGEVERGKAPGRGGGAGQEPPDPRRRDDRRKQTSRTEKVAVGEQN